MNYIVPEGRIPCKTCNRSFSKHSAFLKHFHKRVEGARDYCNICKKYFYNKCEFVHHKFQHKRRKDQKKPIAESNDALEFSSDDEEEEGELMVLGVKNSNGASDKGVKVTNGVTDEEQSAGTSKNKLYQKDTITKIRCGIKTRTVNIERKNNLFLLIIII